MISDTRQALAQIPWDGRPLLKPKEVSKCLGISVRRVKRLDIPRFVLGPRTTRYRPQDIEAVQAKGYIDTSSVAKMARKG